MRRQSGTVLGGGSHNIGCAALSINPSSEPDHRQPCAASRQPACRAWPRACYVKSNCKPSLMGRKALSCGVLVFNPNGELLLGRATGSARWDIPKGIADAHETPLAAALREAAEETGLQLAANALVEVGRFGYLRDKDLALFAAVIEGLEPARCVCTSTFRDAKGHDRPELDAFRWLPWDQVPRLCGRSLAALLAAIDPQPLIARCRPVAAQIALGGPPLPPA